MKIQGCFSHLYSRRFKTWHFIPGYFGQTCISCLPDGQLMVMNRRGWWLGPHLHRHWGGQQTEGCTEGGCACTGTHALKCTALQIKQTSTAASASSLWFTNIYHVFCCARFLSNVPAMQILLKISLHREHTDTEEQELPELPDLEQWWVCSIIFTVVWIVPSSLRQ